MIINYKFLQSQKENTQDCEKIIKFSETNIKLMQLIQRRNLGKASIRKYNIVFREVYKLIGKTPSQLIAEAKKEEQPFTNE
ncbi:hypothetical protein MARBORIA2_13010 [Methanobrevibacter arboriphilus]|uniref:Uncharacterized protein n=1 Tax=Methanobrevibacter arboriphilus TaxID=39441 RepID=A0ACA8R6A0_METAZ|nr:hypothetical protein [Methanobrevibacter arboriphilus]BBL62905.1 hypothetical protein MarbSA_19450 [Methanobrevibacter arboriphilus]GLI12211.1 hypothetical protein MARBORIA2_13010 [Methanobrevibacter arboriphilus]